MFFGQTNLSGVPNESASAIHLSVCGLPSPGGDRNSHRLGKRAELKNAMHLRRGNEARVFEAGLSGTPQGRGHDTPERQRRSGMRTIATFFEIVVSAALLAFGLYLLHEGSSNQSLSEGAILIGGAVCFTLGVMTLVFAVRSIVWHRRMLRHSIREEELEDGAAPVDNRSE